jgi:hypothetical protein
VHRPGRIAVELCDGLFQARGNVLLGTDHDALSVPRRRASAAPPLRRSEAATQPSNPATRRPDDLDLADSSRPQPSRT